MDEGKAMMNTTFTGITLLIGTSASVVLFRRIAVGFYLFRYRQFERTVFARWSLLDRVTKETFLNQHAPRPAIADNVYALLTEKSMDELFLSYLIELRRQMERSGVRDVSSLYDYMEHEMTKKSD